ncbi:MAG: hypothetical protein K6U80_08400 [Firmicutes bacterium]|nr:hypothetical protein [Bacillota bacterium]
MIVLAVVSFAVQTLLRGQPFPEIAAAISIQDGDSLNHTGPSQYFHEGMAVRAVLNPPSFYNLARRILPAWGKVFIIKRIINTSFFFPIMVLLLFFIFYQSSRTSSEGGPPIK